MDESRIDIDHPVTSGPAVAQWGSDHIADVMRALNFDYLALTPGASFRGLHDSLVNYLGNTHPRMLLALHEESAVAIAHGYAKITGKPMGVVLHSNVGLLHASMAIFNAWCERVPMLLYGGNGPMDAAARRPWVDWMHTCTDQAALVRPYTKWDNQPASLAATAEAMLRASMIAQTTPCAPTYVIFDSALQEQKLDKPLPVPDVARYMAPAPAYPAPDTLRQAAKLLGNAKRPLLLAGRGSRTVEAWNNRIALAEALGARVLTSLRTAAAFPSDHPLHAGTPIKFVNDFVIDAVRSSDVILSLDWIDLAGLLKQAWKSEPVNAKVIQASVDVQVHNGFSMDHLGLPAVDLNLLTDPDVAATALLAELRATRPARKFETPAARDTGSGGAIIRRRHRCAQAGRCDQHNSRRAGNLPYPPESWLAGGHDTLQPSAGLSGWRRWWRNRRRARIDCRRRARAARHRPPAARGARRWRFHHGHKRALDCHPQQNSAADRRRQQPLVFQ
jgi:thiamine pyrophosphate-dependent acetolactate synthase large subunit-like protein